MPRESDIRAPGVWGLLRRAFATFRRIDGTEWAGSFAFNAFFSLFPLIVFLVTLSSFFLDQDRAGKEVVTYLHGSVPMTGEMQERIVETIAGVIRAREAAGAAAFLLLLWSGIQCFVTLLSATHRAWGTAVITWWRMPLKSVALLSTTVGAVLLGVALPPILKVAEDILSTVVDVHARAYDLGTFLVPPVIMFGGLVLFFRLAPLHHVRFGIVWGPALATTVLLFAAQSLFEFYFTNFASLNEVYGTFGGIMALLMWIYVSGCILIYGTCLCAAQTPPKGISPVFVRTGYSASATPLQS